LDGIGDCKSLVEAYLNCIREAEKSTQEARGELCRDWTKKYLECRMQHDLMEKESMKNLGFHEEKS
jgi:cytochrome c oxidase assembly protein subunit 19